MGEQTCNIEHLPPELEEIVNSVTSSGIPAKSKQAYEVSYKRLVKFCEEQQTVNFTENVLLAYFSQLSRLPLKSSTLLANFSMIKAVLNEKHNININTYVKLVAFLKQHGKGYTPKKMKALTRGQFDDFLLRAGDNSYLATKVILLFGVAGSCRCEELLNLTVHDISDLGKSILVKITGGRTNRPQSFTITGDFYMNLYRKYAALRPKNMNTTKFFIKYRNNKCLRVVIGRQKMAQTAKDVASFLRLPNSSEYTLRSIRKTSTTITVDDISPVNGKVHAQSQNRTSEIGRPFLTMEPNNKLPVLSERLAGKQETTSTKESFTHTNETIFVEAEPSFLVYYRDNLSLAQKDPLAEDTVQVKFEPKTEPVDCIAEDEVMIKEEFLMYDSVMTDYRIS